MSDDASDKKEKVLHTRVSAELEKDLKSKAAQLGISVSNLVRNALLNTVDLVETVVADSARIAGSAKNLTSPHATPFEDTAPIVGWQEVILNLNAICSECNAILPLGAKAAIALPVSSSHPKVRCLPCLPQSQNIS
tara:strand:+ start:75 stop:482 length:408 start_codon:yes stop_codon:yes gene_type:complete